MNNYQQSEKNQIKKLIADNPGLYISKISEILQMKISIVEIYINEMEKNQELIFYIIDGYKRYFLNKNVKKHHVDRRSREIRENIYSLITKNPGIHLSEVARMIGVNTTLADYHLSQMEKSNLITSIKDSDEYFRRYYLKDSNICIDDKKLLSIFRRDLPLKIVLLLLEFKILRHNEISKKLEVSPSTLTYHLNILLDNNIIVVKDHGKEKGYKIQNKKSVIDFLIKYNFHKLIKNFKDAWIDFSYDYK